MDTTNGDYDATWLLEGLRADKRILAQATAEIDDEYSHDDADRFLRARAMLEGALGVAGGERISGRVYTQAAEELRAAGRSEDAGTLLAIADTDIELRAAAERWRTRYEARPRLTAADRQALDLIGSGQVRTRDGGMAGIDGAWYQDADLYVREDAGPLPAAFVMTAALTAEVVIGFKDPPAQALWMADRSVSSVGGPLASCVTGPECRAVREDRVLAYLLRLGAGSPDPWPGLRPDMMTTDSRAEILLAWRDLAARTPRRGAWLAEAELGSRLLRAPAEAADEIGPNGSTAAAYLRRLADTPVSREQAETAVAWLVKQDGIIRPGADAADRAVRAVAHSRDAHPLRAPGGPDAGVPRPRPSPEDPAAGFSPVM